MFYVLLCNLNKTWINLLITLTEGTVPAESTSVQHAVGRVQTGTCYGEFWPQTCCCQVRRRKDSTIRW